MESFEKKIYFVYFNKFNIQVLCFLRKKLNLKANYLTKISINFFNLSLKLGKQEFKMHQFKIYYL